MKKLYFDIETIPADESSHPALQYLYDRKIGKKMKDKNGTKDEAVLEIGTFEKYVESTGFDGAFGRVLCIAYAVNDEPVRCICNDSNEKKTLEDFWFVAKQIDLFVGHNIMEFDLRFIIQRSIILGVTPAWERFNLSTQFPKDPKFLNFARYKHFPIFDTMQEWSCWGKGMVGLEHVALSMGIPTPKDGIDGSEVWKFYQDGKVKDICDYCMRDVETTRAVYKRMTFEA